MSVATTLLAIGWSPELRNILTVIIAVAVLMGGVYMILATNLGARLGFLIALTGLAGWMFLMGITWAVYGIGLRGKDPTWEAVPGRTVIQDVQALYTAGVFDEPIEIPEGTPYPEQAELVKQEFIAEGWTPLAESDTQFGQASSAAATFLEETGAFEAGEFRAVNVFDFGGERYPSIGDFDLLALRHEPHYVVVEVAPLVATRTEPGPRPGGGGDRHDAPAPVRVHGPRPRDAPPTGVRAVDRRRAHLLRPVLAAAPAGADARGEPQPQRTPVPVG